MRFWRFLLAGNDEMSAKLRRFIDEEKIRSKLESEHFVAIKIDSGSESYMQFAQICKLYFFGFSFETTLLTYLHKLIRQRNNEILCQFSRRMEANTLHQSYRLLRFITIRDADNCSKYSCGFPHWQLAELM